LLNDARAQLPISRSLEADEAGNGRLLSRVQRSRQTPAKRIGRTGIAGEINAHSIEPLKFGIARSVEILTFSVAVAGCRSLRVDRRRAGIRDDHINAQLGASVHGNWRISDRFERRAGHTGRDRLDEDRVVRALAPATNIRDLRI